MKKIITINTDELIRIGELENWRAVNNKYLVQNPNPDMTCIHNKEFIDTELFVLHKGPEDWIAQNGMYICYNESKGTIENAHLIDVSDNIDEEIEALIKNGNSDRLTVSQMKSLGYVFNRETYDNYMQLRLINKKLQRAIITNYDKTKVCYSYPFFKCILECNNETNENNCFFTFVEIIIGRIQTIAFKVEFSNGNIKYYDYSQNPPLTFRIPTLIENIDRVPLGNFWYLRGDLNIREQI
jgi:hypothetical protein